MKPNSLNAMAVAIGLAVSAFANPAHASSVTLLSDNFDTENDGVGTLNYSGFANFTVSNAAAGGAVDLVGNGFQDYWTGNGLYVDICGTSTACGVLTTNQVFAAGNYTITLKLAGNARVAASDTTLVGFGTNSTSYTLSENQSPVDEIWNVTLTSPGYLSIGDTGIGTYVGNFLLSVEVDLNVGPTAVGAAPLPAALPLFATGLGVLGLLGWRRKRRTVLQLHPPDQST
jgi:hypothetical protein